MKHLLTAAYMLLHCCSVDNETSQKPSDNQLHGHFKHLTFTDGLRTVHQTCPAMHIWPESEYRKTKRNHACKEMQRRRCTVWFTNGVCMVY